jgi:ribosomal protein L24E
MSASPGKSLDEKRAQLSFDCAPGQVAVHACETSAQGKERPLKQSSDFSLRALYEALDAQRQARGLSWAQATREMSGQSKRGSAHALSPSTVTGTRTRAVAEGDSVLAMLRWLGRTPESFVPGHSQLEAPGARLPNVPPGKILRFDTKKLHAALDAQRRERKITWAQAAREVGLGVTSLTHLSKGGRTGFPHVMRIVRWLGWPAAEFTRAADR